MRFVPWYPLAEAPRRAPCGPGVFQIRVARGLIDYPRGKSAMIHYGAGEDVGAAIARFAVAHPGASWLCRHSVEHAPAQAGNPSETCERLLARFRARFGSAPEIPASGGEPGGQ